MHFVDNRIGRGASTRAWRTAVFLLFASNGIGVAAWASRTPAIADGLHIGLGQMGALVTGLPAGSIVAILLSSHAIHTLGIRSTARLGVFGQAIGLAAVGLSAGVLSNYGLTFAAFVIYGFSNSITGVVINVQAAEIDRASSRTLMPLFHATFSIGTFVSAGVAAVAVLAGVPIVMHFGIVAALFLVSAIVVVEQLPIGVQPGEDLPASSFGNRMRVWAEPRTLLIGVIVLGAAFTEGTANNWLALAMVEDRGLTAATGAAYLTVFTGSMTVGRLAGGFAVDRLGRVAALRSALALAVAGLLLVIFVTAPVGTIAGVVLWGLGASLGYPLGMSAAADDPINAAARVSAVAAVGALAFLIGPSIVGIIGEHSSLLVAFMVVTGLIAISLAASGAAKPPAARVHHEDLAAASGTEAL